MSKKLTILVTSVDGVGHVNACIGLAQVLQSRGHNIVFMVSSEYRGQLSRYGFTEELLEKPSLSIDSKDNNEKLKPGQKDANDLKKSGMFEPKSPLQMMQTISQTDRFDKLLEESIKTEPQIQQIVAKHRPDLFVIDSLIRGINSPTLVCSGKPWVWLFSAGPLFVLQDERLPPAGSGYPTNGDKNSNEWKELKELTENMFIKHNFKYNKWLKNNGFPAFDNKNGIPESPFLNLYSYPEELDYINIRPLPPKWARVDSFARKNDQEFLIPDRIKEWMENKEKLIYLSMGSIYSANIEVMKRLVNILSKCEHKFIVSKGLSGEEYELPDNMWGQNSVPQITVLPLVHLVITHGGNNTVAETFSYGKPMIVLPLFGDQFDNAQRVQEKGFGLRLDPYFCTEEELIGGIHKLLNDNDLKNRLNAASKRMLSSDSLIEVSKQIENLVKT